ncbi:MAG: ABC transporter permease [Clostridia bacterium]|nr:ABC transporter permease [Clostridia bacterium]
MLRIVKKAESSPRRVIAQRAGFILLSLVAAALVILVLGYNPIQVYAEMIKGALNTSYRFQETVLKAVPLIIMALGVSVCFKLNFSNIGTEGQFYMGAMAATYVALFLPIPDGLRLPLMFIVSFAVGGLYCLIPALLKIKWHVSETLVTLMMNYIASKLVAYLQYGPWKDPKAYGFPKIADFPKIARLPEVLDMHIGWIIALVLAVVMYLLLNRSKFGYEIQVMGQNKVTARYAGMNSVKITVLTVIIGGGLCGLAGMIQAAGIERTLNDQLASGSLCFTAIVVAWLAKLNPIAIVPAGFAFAVLLQGGSYIQSALQVPSTAAEIVQGIILLFVLASEFFISYKFQRTGKKAEEVQK